MPDSSTELALPRGKDIAELSARHAIGGDYTPLVRRVGREGSAEGRRPGNEAAKGRRGVLEGAIAHINAGELAEAALNLGSEYDRTVEEVDDTVALWTDAKVVRNPLTGMLTYDASAAYTDPTQRIQAEAEASRIHTDALRYRAYLESGFDALPAPDQDILRAKGKVFIQNTPALDFMFAGPVPTDAEVEVLLKDPNFIKYFGSALHEMHNPQILTPELAGKFAEAKSRLEDAKSDHEPHQRQKKEFEDTIADAEGKLSDFNTVVGAGGRTKLHELRALEGSATVQALQSKEQTIAQLKHQKEAVVQGRANYSSPADYNRDIHDIDNQISAVQTTIPALLADPDVTRFKALSDERGRQLIRIRMAQEGLGELMEKYKKTRDDLRTAEGAFASVKAEKDAQVDAAKQAHEKVIKVAGTKALKDSNEAVIAKTSEFNNEERRNQIQQGLRNDLKDMLRKKRGRFSFLRRADGDTEFDIDEKSARDLNQILIQQGPDAFIRQLAKSNPKYADITQKDVEALRSDLSIQVMSSYIATGGSFSEKSLNSILRIHPEFIKVFGELVQNEENVKRGVAQVLGSEAIASSGTFKSSMEKLMEKRGVRAAGGILLIILALIAGTGIGSSIAGAVTGIGAVNAARTVGVGAGGLIAGRELNRMKDKRALQSQATSST